MNLYELTYSDWEDFRFYLLTHHVRDYEDFKADCDKILITQFDEYLKGLGRMYAGVDSMVDFIKKKLIDDLGYVEVKTQRYGYSGPAMIMSRRDDDIKEIIGEDNLNKAVKHTKKILKASEKRYEKYRRNKEQGSSN